MRDVERHGVNPSSAERGIFTPRKSIYAHGAIGLLVFSIGIAIISIALHRLGIMRTPTFLACASTSVLGLIATIGISSIALRRIWRRAELGAPLVLWSLVVAITALSVPVLAGLTLIQLPAINDISTDTANPPEYGIARIQRPRDANSTRYPYTAFSELQTKYYPDVKPMLLGSSPELAFAFVRSVAEYSGWNIVDLRSPETNGSIGILEAVDTTTFFGFRDDIIVRVRPVSDGSVIDVRSSSRYGQHDFGSNAVRIQHFLKELQERVERDRLTY